MLNDFEKQTSVPKVYAFLGLVGIYFFLVFFNIAGEFLVNFAGFLIPGYFSLEALFSTSTTDDTQVKLFDNTPRIRYDRADFSNSGLRYVHLCSELLPILQSASLMANSTG